MRVLNKLKSLSRIFIFPGILLFFSINHLQAQKESQLPIRGTIDFLGVEREYYVLKPQNFKPDRLYWLLVVVHGGNGNGATFWMTDKVKNAVDKFGLEAIVVAPSFSNTDFQASRFPDLGEGEFLKMVIKELHSKFHLRQKILLTGYSRGGQFSHRFAFGNPELVKACAPFASGTWTTPDGKLLIESIGEVSYPKSYLSSKKNMNKVPERLRGIFDPRVAKVAGLKAKDGSQNIPFLIMCGTLDTRFEIAQQFALSLKTREYSIQTEWPQTPHGGHAEFKSEFEKYPRSAVEFFLNVTKGR